MQRCDHFFGGENAWADGDIFDIFLVDQKAILALFFVVGINNGCQKLNVCFVDHHGDRHLEGLKMLVYVRGTERAN